MSLTWLALFFQYPLENNGRIRHDNHWSARARSRLTAAVISSPLSVALRFLNLRIASVACCRFRLSNSFRSASLTTWLRRRGGTRRNSSSRTFSSIETCSLTITFSLYISRRRLHVKAVRLVFDPSQDAYKIHLLSHPPHCSSRFTFNLSRFTILQTGSAPSSSSSDERPRASARSECSG